MPTNMKMVHHILPSQESVKNLVRKSLEIKEGWRYSNQVSFSQIPTNWNQFIMTHLLEDMRLMEEIHTLLKM